MKSWSLFSIYHITSINTFFPLYISLIHVAILNNSHLGSDAPFTHPSEVHQ